MPSPCLVKVKIVAVGGVATCCKLMRSKQTMHASRARSLERDGRDHSRSMKQPAVVPNAECISTKRDSRLSRLVSTITLPLFRSRIAVAVVPLPESVPLPLSFREQVTELDGNHFP